MRRWTLRRVVVLLAVVDTVLAVGLFALRPPGATHAVETLPSLPGQVTELPALVDARRTGEAYELTLTDDELSAVAGYFLNSADDVPFSNIRVMVAESRVSASGVTKGLAVRVPVRVVATVGARGGLPVATVEDVSLGDTALPGFVRDQILREANRSLDFSRYDLPITVDAITLEAGRLTGKGTIR